MFSENHRDEDDEDYTPTLDESSCSATEDEYDKEIYASELTSAESSSSSSLSEEEVVIQKSNKYSSNRATPTSGKRRRKSRYRRVTKAKKMKRDKEVWIESTTITRDYKDVLRSYKKYQKRNPHLCKIVDPVLLHQDLVGVSESDDAFSEITANKIRCQYSVRIDEVRQVMESINFRPSIQLSPKEIALRSRYMIPAMQKHFKRLVDSFKPPKKIVFTDEYKSMTSKCDEVFTYEDPGERAPAGYSTIRRILYDYQKDLRKPTRVRIMPSPLQVAISTLEQFMGPIVHTKSNWCYDKPEFKMFTEQFPEHWTSGIQSLVHNLVKYCPPTAEFHFYSGELQALAWLYWEIASKDMISFNENKFQKSRKSLFIYLLYHLEETILAATDMERPDLILMEVQKCIQLSRPDNDRVFPRSALLCARNLFSKIKPLACVTDAEKNAWSVFFKELRIHHFDFAHTFNELINLRDKFYSYIFSLAAEYEPDIHDEFKSSAKFKSNMYSVFYSRCYKEAINRNAAETPTIFRRTDVKNLFKKYIKNPKLILNRFIIRVDNFFMCWIEFLSKYIVRTNGHRNYKEMTKEDGAGFLASYNRPFFEYYAIPLLPNVYSERIYKQIHKAIINSVRLAANEMVEMTISKEFLFEFVGRVHSSMTYALGPALIQGNKLQPHKWCRLFIKQFDEFERKWILNNPRIPWHTDMPSWIGDNSEDFDFDPTLDDDHEYGPFIGFRRFMESNRKGDYESDSSVYDSSDEDQEYAECHEVGISSDFDEDDSEHLDSSDDSDNENSNIKLGGSKKHRTVQSHEAKMLTEDAKNYILDLPIPKSNSNSHRIDQHSSRSVEISSVNKSAGTRNPVEPSREKNVREVTETNGKRLSIPVTQFTQTDRNKKQIHFEGSDDFIQRLLATTKKPISKKDAKHIVLNTLMIRNRSKPFIRLNTKKMFGVTEQLPTDPGNRSTVCVLCVYKKYTRFNILLKNPTENNIGYSVACCITCLILLNTLIDENHLQFDVILDKLIYRIHYRYKSPLFFDESYRMIAKMPVPTSSADLYRQTYNKLDPRFGRNQSALEIFKELYVHHKWTLPAEKRPPLKRCNTSATEATEMNFISTKKPRT